MSACGPLNIPELQLPFSPLRTQQQAYISTDQRPVTLLARARLQKSSAATIGVVGLAAAGIGYYFWKAESEQQHSKGVELSATK